jgi:hypothetical protein
LHRSALAFQAKDFGKGIPLWQQGLKEMNDAVALEPAQVEVLVPRGATLLPISHYVPDPAESRELLKIGVADYEKVLGLQKSYFATLSSHARGELLFGLADGWYRLQDPERSRHYLQRISSELPGSEYARRAADWLSTTDDAALQQKSRTLTCIGCHGD